MSIPPDADSSQFRPADPHNSESSLRSQRGFFHSFRSTTSNTQHPTNTSAPPSERPHPSDSTTPGYNPSWSFPAGPSSSNRNQPPPHQSHSVQTRASAQPALPSHPSQPQTSSMIGPPPMFYDGQVDLGSQGVSESYQPWIHGYDQAHIDFSRLNNVLANPSFNSQSHLQPHSRTAAGSAPILDMASSALQPTTQNQYSYATPQGHFIHPMDTHDIAYDQQQYVQPRTIPRQQLMAQRIPRQVQQQHAQQSVPAASRGDYSGTQHRHIPTQQQQQLPNAPNVYEYQQQQQQQQQHQQSYAPPTTDRPHYAQTITPEPPMEPNEVQQRQQQQPPQGQFTFAWYPPQSEVPQANIANSASSSSYAPSPDPTSTIPPSASPSSWGGTEDDRSRRSHPPGQSVSPQPPSSATVTAPAPSKMNTAPAFRMFQHRTQGTGKRERGRPKATKASPKKRRRNDPDVESDSGSEDDEQEAGGSNVVPPLRGTGTIVRLPGACSYCKKLKMKCEFPEDENTCKRCKQSGHHCVVEGRKRTTIPNKREYLLAQIRQKDHIIESLLKQLHNPYLATQSQIDSYRMATSPSDQSKQNVLEWLGRLQDSVKAAGHPSGTNAFDLSSRGTARGEDVGADGSDGGDSVTSDPTRGPGTVHGGGSGVLGQQQQPKDIEEQRNEDEKLHSIPDAAVPLGLIANLSLSNHRKGGRRGNDNDDNVGLGNETYFRPGPAFDLSVRKSLIEQHNTPPEIVAHGLVTPTDVDNLFKIFYERLNTHVSLLDPKIHTPSETLARCPFLYTVICAISSRYYEDKSEIYPIAMHFAKHAAANALVTGWKSVELAQAYILMSIYSVPARRWEDDRSWLYAGLAIRIATDLNLHQPSAVKPTDERQEREILNRTRTWMICYNQDRSTATQYGKPATIKEDFIMRQSADWYKKSPYNDHYDIGMCAYNSLLQVVARFHDEIFSDPDSPSGLNENLDFLAVTTRHDENLSRFYDEWVTRFARDADMSDLGTAFRCSLLPFLTGYSRLVMYSFGFQRAYRCGIQASDRVFVDKCYDAAKTVITCMVDDLAPSGYMRFSPDGHFIFATFASAFLLKLLKPEFKGLISKTQEGEIFDLIERLIQTLNSSEIAIDDRHTPRLHARFLSGLLSKHRRDVSRTERSHSQQPPQTEFPSGSSGTYSGQPPQPGTGPSGQAYPVQPPQGGSHEQQSMGQSRAPSENPIATDAVGHTEPVYPPAALPVVEVSYAAEPPNVAMEDDMFGIGALQVLKNPVYWQTMSMPGFHMADSCSAPMYHHHQGIPGITTGFSTLQAGLQYS